MRNFFTSFLASFLAVCVALLVLVLIGLGSISALVGSKTEEMKLIPGTILVLDLSTRITDRTIDNPFDFFDYQTLTMQGTLGLHDIQENLKKAVADPNIAGVLIKSYASTSGIATLSEIRGSLARFKESGKFILAYSTLFTQGAYYLSSIADKVYMSPEGMMEFKGLRADVMFYRKALEKIGVKVEVIREGRYKSAVEPFLRNNMSDYNREQVRAYVHTIWDEMVKAISVSRNLTVERINELADHWTPHDPKAARDSGLVDDLIYEDELQKLIRDRLGVDENEKITMVDMGAYTLAPDPRKKEYTSDRIAVIYASGNIAMESTGSLSIGANLAKTFAQVRKDHKIKAVVFRVNSGGGDGIASDLIRREVALTAAKKPVIVSMGDMAASGGYMISAPATHILADPMTLTGSIGAFGLIPSFGDLMNDKLGITIDGIQTNKMSGAGSIYREMTDSEREVFNDMLNQTYHSFVAHVAETRGMTWDEVNAIGEGHVWTGVAGVKNGLVDQLGSLDDAIELAAKKVGLSKYRIRELPVLKDPIQELINQVTNRSLKVKAPYIKGLPWLNDLKELANAGQVQTRLPYRIEVH